MKNKKQKNIRNIIKINSLKDISKLIIYYYKYELLAKSEFYQQKKKFIILLNDYKKIIGGLDSNLLIKVAVSNCDNNIFGETRTSVDIINKKTIINISLGEKIVKNPEYYLIVKGISIYKKWSSKVEKNNIHLFTITHEFAHLLEEIIILIRFYKQTNFNNYSYFRTMEALHIRDEVIALGKKRNNNFNENLSKYSKYNNFEWFAETFTNMDLSINSEPIALALKEFLDIESIKINSK